VAIQRSSTNEWNSWLVSAEHQRS